MRNTCFYHSPCNCLSVQKHNNPLYHVGPKSWETEHTESAPPLLEPAYPLPESARPLPGYCGLQSRVASVSRTLPPEHVASYCVALVLATWARTRRFCGSPCRQCKNAPDSPPRDPTAPAAIVAGNLSCAVQWRTRFPAANECHHPLSPGPAVRAAHAGDRTWLPLRGIRIQARQGCSASARGAAAACPYTTRRRRGVARGRPGGTWSGAHPRTTAGLCAQTGHTTSFTSYSPARKSFLGEC